MDNTDLKVVVETPEERRKRFLIEFEKPFKCEKCNERFKKKKLKAEKKISRKKDFLAKD